MKQLRKALENQVWLLVAVRGVELPVRNEEMEVITSLKMHVLASP